MMDQGRPMRDRNQEGDAGGYFRPVLIGGAWYLIDPAIYKRPTENDDPGKQTQGGSHGCPAETQDQG